ncbi:MAG: thiolase family protein, partial [Candidatus Brocadiae bacterium]|nr:thiolase family protein [Candidatus Brocadiia bacterium]
MKFEKVCIPYGAYWSTPFCRWQGSLAHRHSVKFAAEVAAQALKARGLDAKSLDGLALGMTVPQKSSFYGGPWLASLVGAGGITGPVVSQACATGARTLANAALEVECGGRNAVLAVACDRTSNGMHIYYPNPGGPGGRGDAEDWVWDNFSRDPFAMNSMLDTAERLAKEAGYRREEQDALAALRHRQYADALANDSAFLKRYMALPFEVKDESGRKVVATLAGDEGIPPTTAEGLAKLRPAVDGGSVTPGTQTRPADGNCGALVVSQNRAKEWSRGPFEVRLLAYAEAR